MQRIGETARAARDWLLGVPATAALAAGAGLALNAASDLGNSFGAAPRFGGPLVAVATLAAFAGLFALGLWATAAHPTAPLPGRLRWLTLPLAALVLWSGVQSLRVVVADYPRALASPAQYGSDELYDAQYNAHLLLSGVNPYAGDHLAGALRAFDSDQVTPIRAAPYSDPLRPPTAGELRAIVAAYLADPAGPHPNLNPATTHSYPALSFVLAAPSVWLGLPTLGFGQVAALLALIVGIALAAPARLRVIAVALCLLDVDGIRSVAGSDLAIWTAAGVALVWALRERPWAAAVALGAVCAVQQTAWLAAPFYLLWAWRARGGRAAAREGAAAVGIFAALNLPWIVASPGPWLTSLALPVALPLFPTGGGLVGLALGGALPLWSPAVYAALEGLGYLGSLLAYARWSRRAPLAGLVVPTTALLLAWRSPSRYFILLPLLIALAVALRWRAADKHAAHGAPVAEPAT